MAGPRAPRYGITVMKPLAMVVPLVVTALGALGACTSSTSTPAPAPTDPPATEEAPSGESDPAPANLEPFTQDEIQALFDERCLRCHGPSNALLDLSAPFTRETVGVATNEGQKRGFCESSAYKTRIVPGDREASLLWHKVKGTQDCGSRMPYDKGDKKLDATELERLGLWIDGLSSN
jgi:hypothetical protein